jgi:hypothetical protein
MNNAGSPLLPKQFLDLGEGGCLQAGIDRTASFNAAANFR